MARQNRRDIFDPNEVGDLHAVQRTVRRAWLCGMNLSPENRSNIAGLGSKIDCKNLRPASELIAFPLR